jgi:hypothetical protein
METIRYGLLIETNAAGAFTGYITPVVSGLLYQVRFTAGLADGYGVTITLENTEVKCLVVPTESVSGANTWLPRHVNHDNDDGSELIHETAGSGAFSDIRSSLIAVGGERIKVVVASGGDKQTATCYVWIVAGAGDVPLAASGGWGDAGYTA